MEPQSWSVQNYYSYSCREFFLLVFNQFKLLLKPAFSIPVFLVIFFYMLGATLILVAWRFPDFVTLGLCIGFSFTWALVTGVLYIVVFFLVAWLGGFLFHKLIPTLTVEISRDGMKCTTDLNRAKVVPSGWSSIQHISQRFNLIFIKYKRRFIPQLMVIPLRLFKDQAESERFYADLNYFWEQGR